MKYKLNPTNGADITNASHHGIFPSIIKGLILFSKCEKHILSSPYCNDLDSRKLEIDAQLQQYLSPSNSHELFLKGTGTSSTVTLTK